MGGGLGVVGDLFGEALWALRNSNPSRAMRSKVGVFTTGSPRQEACGQPQSSAKRKRMLGRWSAAAAPRRIRERKIDLKYMRVLQGGSEGI